MKNKLLIFPLDMFNLLKKSPLFSKEIKKGLCCDDSSVSYYYKQLRIRGYPIQRTVISGRAKGGTKTRVKRRGKSTIYYLLIHRKEALERVRELFSGNFNNTLLHSFGPAILDGEYNFSYITRKKRRIEDENSNNDA